MEIAGFHFLPSQEWAERVRPWTIPLYIVTTAAFGGLIPHMNKNSTEIRTAWHDIKLVLGCAMLGLAGPGLANTWPPVIKAMTEGSIVTLTYFVAGTSSSKGCRAGLRLKDLPMMHNALCNIGYNERREYPKGTLLAVTGYGTDWGLFPASFKKIK
jgi:hypothetical protein